MTIKLYYDILGIDSKSDLATIKKAFRSKIAIYHPDKNKSPEAAQIFEDLVEAFDILSNSEKRQAYDKMLSEAKTNKPIIIEQKEEGEEEENQQQYKEWQKEAKKKSKTYSSKTLEDLLLLDIFLDLGLDGLFHGADDIVDGISDALSDVFDLF